MKWFIILFVLFIAYALSTGYMGGAREATGNYNKILSGRPAAK